MVNFGKAISMYITTDGDLCISFMKKICMFIKLFDLCSEVPGETVMLESLEL
jgi:hypothetical protein